MKNTKYKALFADLDGTIIETISGKTFPEDINDWKFKDNIIDAIRNFNPKYLIIVSNQGGIEKGFIKKEDFEKKFENIKDTLISYLGYINVCGTYCSSNDKENKYRKPNIGMIDIYLDTFVFDKEEYLMIGDASGKEGQFSDSDKKCAENAGIDYMDVEDFVNEYGKK